MMERFTSSARRVGRALAPLAILLFVVGAVGCNGDDVDQSDSGQINAFPQPISFSQVSLGSSETKSLTIRNSGDGTLRIFEIDFEAKEGASVSDLSLGNVPGESFDIEPGESRALDVIFEPTESGPRNEGTIRIFNSDPAYSQEDPLEVDVRTLANSPQLQVAPSTVRFPPLVPGKTFKRTVTLRNVGEAPLRIFEGLSITGSDDYRITSTSEELPHDLAVPGDDVADEKTRMRVEITYAPTTDGSPTGELVIKSNEEPGTTEDEPTLDRIEINANADTPCLLLNPANLDLGATPIGGTTAKAFTVENCGTEPLRISSIDIAENTQQREFGLDLGDRDGDGNGELDTDLVLDEQGDSANIAVRYTPQQAGTDQGKIVIGSNDPTQPEAEVRVAARGATGECPETMLRGRPETGTLWDQSVVRAAPLDYVLLDGSMSEDPDGEIADYTWTVEKAPNGASEADFKPWKNDTTDSNKAKRRLRLLVAGEYRISLKVEDNDGFLSCEKAELRISAEPDEKIHVELTWKNPDDPDAFDDTGDDVDLHLVKMGPGKWFRKPYDIYFDNPGGGGGGGSGIWNPESPSLDIDDRNGLGPENIQMDDPQSCQWYAIGVHYFEAEFPPTYATIRVYLGEGKSNLVFEKRRVKLDEGNDFWDVARIHWPSKQVLPVGQTRIYDSRSAVDGQDPAVTPRMKSSGLCTSNDLYSSP